MLHGDFVRLRIDAASPSVDLHMALCEQESADAQRYIFGRSPSRSPTPTDSVQPEEEEYPSEEEAASASLLQLHAAMTSTILSGDSEDKVGLRTNERLIKLGGRAVLQDITDVARGPTESGKPPVKGLVSDGHAEGPDVTTLRPPPHVFDRWCGDAVVGGTSELHCLRHPPPVPIELARAVELTPPPKRIPIELAGALEPAPPHKQTSDGLDFRPAANFLELLDSHLLLTSFDFTTPLGWHHTSYDWLGYPWWEVDEPLQEVHIYIDGSSREVTGKPIMLRTLHFGTPTSFSQQRIRAPLGFGLPLRFYGCGRQSVCTVHGSHPCGMCTRNKVHDTAMRHGLQHHHPWTTC